MTGAWLHRLEVEGAPRVLVSLTPRSAIFVQHTGSGPSWDEPRPLSDQDHYRLLKGSLALALCAATAILAPALRNGWLAAMAASIVVVLLPTLRRWLAHRSVVQRRSAPARYHAVVFDAAARTCRLLPAREDPRDAARGDGMHVASVPLDRVRLAHELRRGIPFSDAYVEGDGPDCIEAALLVDAPGEPGLQGAFDILDGLPTAYAGAVGVETRGVAERLSAAAELLSIAPPAIVPGSRIQKLTDEEGLV